MKLTPINPHFNACDQQWELMLEQDGGRLCDACERVLIDFTPLSEQEMLNKHRESETKLCGRYTRGQVDRLHRHLALEESKSRPWLVTLAMGIGASLPFSLGAQQPTNEVLIGDTILPPISYDIPIDETIPMPGTSGQTQYQVLDVDTTIDVVELKGTVIDGETGEPIPHASILIADTDTGVVTDIDGNFSFKVPYKDEELILTTSFIGYEISKTSVDLKEPQELIITIYFDKNILIQGELIYEKLTVGKKLKLWSNPAYWYRRIRNKIRYR